MGWVGAVGAGRSADGGGGGSVFAGGVGRGECELAEEGREEGASGTPQIGCCGPLGSVGKGSKQSLLCRAW